MAPAKFRDAAAYDNAVELARAAGFMLLPPCPYGGEWWTFERYWQLRRGKAKCTSCGHVLKVGQRAYMRRHALDKHGIAVRIGREPLPMFEGTDLRRSRYVGVRMGSRQFLGNGSGTAPCTCGHLGDATDPHNPACAGSPLRQPYLDHRAQGSRAIDAWEAVKGGTRDAA